MFISSILLQNLVESHLYIDSALENAEKNTIDGRIIMDILVGITIPLIFFIGYFRGKIKKTELILFFIGFAIGAVLEFYTWEQGRSFFYVKMHWPLPWVTYYICHTFWDAGLYMAGYYIARRVLKKRKSEFCASFDFKELLVMLIWGGLTAFIGELAGNGVIWQYVPRADNPVWISIGEQSYTILVQAFWFVSPVLFYAACLYVNKIKVD